jgi:hypothetical protein
MGGAATGGTGCSGFTGSGFTESAAVLLGTGDSASLAMCTDARSVRAPVPASSSWKSGTGTSAPAIPGAIGFSALAGKRSAVSSTHTRAPHTWQRYGRLPVIRFLRSSNREWAWLRCSAGALHFGQIAGEVWELSQGEGVMKMEAWTTFTIASHPLVKQIKDI